MLNIFLESFQKTFDKFRRIINKYCSNYFKE